MKKFLSWDCATKSLTWALLEIDTEANQKIKKFQGEKRSRDQVVFVKNFIKIHSSGVINLIGDEKVANVELSVRIKRLSEFLIGFEMPSLDTIVLIEKQPETINSRVAPIAHCLSYHFASYQQSFVSPKLKNKIALKYCLLLPCP